METLKAIQSRTSTRAFLAKPVSQELVAQVLDAARWAPSGSNGQRWQVTVVTGTQCEQLSKQLAERVSARKPASASSDSAPADMNPNVNTLRAGLTRIGQALGQSLWEFVVLGSYELYHAPVVVVVSNVGKRGDASQFVTTMLLAAHDMGLGTCWLGYPLSESDVIRQILEIPEEQQISAVVALGYPDPDSPAYGFRSPRKELDQFVRWVGFD